MAKNISITVRLKQYEGKNTSSKKTISKKNRNTSSGNSIASESGGSSIDGALGGASRLLKGKGMAGKFGLVGASVVATSKAVGIAGDISGTVTDDKFMTKNIKDMSTFMLNPAKALPAMFNRFFDLQRELEKVDIKRQRTNTYLPYRHGDAGVTL